MTRMPALFISHGAPDLAVRAHAAHRFLKSLGQQLPAPKAILIASAHWPTQAPVVATTAKPETIYDFGGFDPRLYTMRYPAPGAPEIALHAQNCLRAAGLEASADATRGFDHGVWTPLILLYPDAQIPVAQVSIQPDRDPRHHFEIVRALAPLREEGIMVIGSGALTHNLRAYFGGGEETPPPAWVAEFTEWMRARLEAGDEAQLLDYRSRAPHAERNHPEDEHLLPLFIPFGSRAQGEPVRRLHQSTDRGVLAMDVYGVGLE